MHSLFVVCVHGVVSYSPGEQMSVQIEMNVPPRQYEFSWHSVQTLFVEFEHCVVSNVPGAHETVHASIDVFPRQ